MKAPLAFQLIVLFTSLILCCGLTAQQDSAEKLIRVTESLRPNLVEEGQPLLRLSERMKRYNTPGVSLAIIDNFRLVGTYESGRVNAKEPREVGPETRFQAASISKLVNAVGVLRLVESGKLDLDADVNTLLKSWKIPASPEFSDAIITPRMLLAHTAGLSTHGFGGYRSAKDLPSAIAVLNKSAGVNSQRVKIIQEPGKAFKYSGGGTTIIQVLVEDLTGVAYTNYMQKEVLEPLGMTSSFYSVNQAGKESLRATAHYAKGKPLKNGPKAFSLQLVPLSPTKYLAKGASPEVTLEFLDDGTMQVTQGEVTVFEREE